MSANIDMTRLNEHERMVAQGAGSWWTPRETAEFLGVTVATLAKWRSLATHPDLPYVKYGHNVLYDPEAVRNWFHNRLKPRTSTHIEDCTRNQHLVRSRS